MASCTASSASSSWRKAICAILKALASTLARKLSRARVDSFVDSGKSKYLGGRRLAGSTSNVAKRFMGLEHNVCQTAPLTVVATKGVLARIIHLRTVLQVAW